MPFTPFHWGLPLLISEQIQKSDRKKSFTIRIRLFTLVASSFPDVEGVIYILSLYYPTFSFHQVKIHGPLHSFVGSIILGVLTVILAYFYTKLFNAPRITISEAVFYFFTPLVFHIIPDLLMYSDMPLFWPFNEDTNPYVITGSSFYLYSFGALILILYGLYLTLNIVRKK